MIASRQDLHRRISDLRGANVAHAIATVVRAESPTSCQVGDKAVIGHDGHIHGWIGGSCAQPTVVAEARQSLVDGEPRLVLLTPDSADGARPGVTVREMRCFSGGVAEVFIEPFLPAPLLLVWGVSPTAKAVASIGQAVGFAVMVIDPDASTEQFSGAQIVTSWSCSDALQSPRDCYAVIATHGMRDEEALREALTLARGSETHSIVANLGSQSHHPAATSPTVVGVRGTEADGEVGTGSRWGGLRYIALVASQRRFDATIASLRADGVDEDLVQRIASRPGIAINARTFEEVGLAITAELVSVRRAQTRPSDRGTGILVPELVEDPICGMMVDPSTSVYFLDIEDHRWHYCNARCRRVHARQLGVTLGTEAAP